MSRKEEIINLFDAWRALVVPQETCFLTKRGFRADQLEQYALPWLRADSDAPLVKIVKMSDFNNLPPGWDSGTFFHGNCPDISVKDYFYFRKKP